MAVETCEICPNCGKQLQVTFGERPTEERLTWYISRHCGDCGYAEEADGYDQLPTEYRDLEIHQNNTWTLQVNSLGSKPAKGLQAIKSTLNLAYDTLAVLKQDLPTRLVSGTKAEMTFYKKRIISSYDDIQLVIERIIQ